MDPRHDRVHNGHGDRRRPLQAERHDLPLEVAQQKEEAGPPSVGLPQLHLMVALGELDLGEAAGATHLVREGVDVLQRLHERPVMTLRPRWS